MRVTSYNIRALKQDRARVVEVVRALRPDLLLLQEAPRHPVSGHRLAALADDVGLTWFGGRRFRMSTTLMTSLRLDVLDATHGRLPVHRYDEPRGYAMATVRLPGHRAFRAVSVHLPLRKDERLPHVRRLLDLTGGQPAVLGGDLNEEPTGAAWRHLAASLPEVSPAAPTYSAQDPHKQIDAIFASPQLTGTRPEVSVSPQWLAEASDHLPVTVDLDVTELRDPQG